MPPVLPHSLYADTLLFGIHFSLVFHCWRHIYYITFKILNDVMTSQQCIFNSTRLAPWMCSSACPMNSGSWILMLKGKLNSWIFISIQIDKFEIAGEWITATRSKSFPAWQVEWQEFNLLTLWWYWLLPVLPVPVLPGLFWAIRVPIQHIPILFAVTNHQFQLR